jgi:phosphatidylserine/phosphatidylglycerophosphate/cardiolipin synthase-like enzyme
MDVSDQALDHDEALQRHAAAHSPVSDCPLVGGAGVTLLPSGGHALDAVFATIDAASRQLHMEYYEFEDVHWGGRSLVDLLVEKLRQGVRVALSYDGLDRRTPTMRCSTGCARRAARCWNSARSAHCAGDLIR